MNTIFSVLLLVLGVTAIEAQDKAHRLIVQGVDGTEIAFSAEQLKGMRRETVSVVDERTKATQEYQGVRLGVLLAEVASRSEKQSKRSDRRDYVIAAGSDNYRVLFSLAELNPDFQDNKVLVADTKDGKPLDAAHGPLQLIVPHDRRTSRWVRMLASIRVAEAP
jgi:hypothetical protein